MKTCYLTDMDRYSDPNFRKASILKRILMLDFKELNSISNSYCYHQPRSCQRH